MTFTFALRDRLIMQATYFCFAFETWKVLLRWARFHIECDEENQRPIRTGPERICLFKNCQTEQNCWGSHCFSYWHSCPRDPIISQTCVLGMGRGSLFNLLRSLSLPTLTYLSIHNQCIVKTIVQHLPCHNRFSMRLYLLCAIISFVSFQFCFTLLWNEAWLLWT